MSFSFSVLLLRFYLNLSQTPPFKGGIEEIELPLHIKDMYVEMTKIKQKSDTIILAKLTFFLDCILLRPPSLERFALVPTMCLGKSVYHR